MNQFTAVMSYTKFLEFQVMLSNSHRELNHSNSKGMIDVAIKYADMLGDFIEIVESPKLRAKGVEIQSSLRTSAATYTKPKKAHIRQNKGGWIYHDPNVNEKRETLDDLFDSVDEYVIEVLRDFRNTRGIV